MNEPRQQIPPKRADQLLAWFCAPHLLEDIQGDLHELYRLRLERHGARVARLRYWIDVIRFFRPYVLRRKQPAYQQARGPIMLKNYLKVALRTLQRQKGYAFINMFGLAVGMACCLLILLYIQDELSYDRHHIQADRTFRLTATFDESDNHWAPIGPPVGAAFKASIPEVEEVARIFPFGNSVLHHEDRQFEENNGVFADSTVFEVFTIPLLRGNPKTALNRAFTVVISQEMARRYFGDEDPMGQVLSTSGSWEFTVTGVMEDPPPTTHLPFDFLLSMQTYYDGTGDWVNEARTWAGFYTYVLLRSTESVAAVETKLPTFINDFYAGVFDEGVPAEQMDLILQPIRDIHLHSQLEKEYRANSDITYVYLFGIIALFVLLIACINFVNLATARATTRMREVGVRKALGAWRSQLARQFLGESLLMTLLAVALAGGLILLTLPVFNNLTSKALSIGDLQQPVWLLGLGAVALFTGLVSGIYPALVLSSFRPVQALRGRGGTSSLPVVLRKGLVVFQFTISIFLIVGTMVVWNQLTFVRTQQLGFNKEHVINVRLNYAQRESMQESLEAFKEEMLRNPAITSVSLAPDVPGERYSLESFIVDGQQDAEETMMRVAWGADVDYLPALGLELVAGRNFSLMAPADTNAWILNEAAVRRLELEDPIGQVLRWNSADYAGPIVGIVKDFHFASLHHQIEPLVIPLRPGIGNFLLVRAQAGQAPQALAAAEEQLDRFAPGQIFRYSFLSSDFDQLYRTEDRLQAIFGYFSGIAIVIACLGLFGLAAFTAEQRTREIGVRKVLGASVGSIVSLLSKDSLWLVLIAFGVAIPLSYFAMNRWLEGFPYRISLGVEVFLMAGLLAIATALLTVGYQAVRAALTDPVKSLRHE